MSTNRKLIPFNWWPANWGLAGSRRLKAEAEYYLEGYPLRKRLNEIDRETYGAKPDILIDALNIDLEFGVIDKFTFELEKGRIEIQNEAALALFEIELEFQYNKIDKREREMRVLDLSHPDKETVEYQIAEINIQQELGEITKNQAEKAIATLKNEPWFNVIDTEYKSREDLGSAINFELDWNEQHIHYLMERGVKGNTPEEIIDKWFTALCADIFKEFEQTEPPKLASGMRTNVNFNGDTSEHS